MSLTELYVELNGSYFNYALPLPRLRYDKRLSSTAGYFRVRTQNLPFGLPYDAEIGIADYLRARKDGMVHIRDTMLHEMIHFHLFMQKRPHGHTPEFKAIAKAFNVSCHNRVPKVRHRKIIMECPNCLEVYRFTRKVQKGACLSCCKKFNRGRFSAAYVLQKVDPYSPNAWESVDFKSPF